jgi:cullin 3
VLKNKGQELYDGVKRFQADWLSKTVRARLREQMAGTLLARGTQAISSATPTEKRSVGERFMHNLKQTYEDHVTCMNMTTDVLMYMVSISLLYQFV